MSYDDFFGNPNTSIKPDQGSSFFDARDGNFGNFDMSAQRNSMSYPSAPATRTHLPSTGSSFHYKYRRNPEFISFVVQGVDEFPEYRYRNYEVNLSRESVDNLGLSIARANGQISPIVIAESIGSIMHASVPGNEIIDVPNGWRARRYRFVLTLRLFPKATEGVMEYMMIAGYSDYFEPLSWNTKTIDPHMPFTIAHIQRFTVNAATGVPMCMNDFSRILINSNHNQMSGGHALHMLRPQDTLSANNSNDVFGQYQLSYNNEGVPVTYEDVHVMNVRLGNLPEKCQVQYDSAPSYVAKLFESVTHAKNVAQVGEFTGGMDTYSHSDNGSVYDHARTMLTSDSTVSMASRDPFLALLMSASDDQTGVKARFTLTDLARIDPQISDKMDLSMVGDQRYGMLTGHMQGDDPNEISEYTRVAYTIALGMSTVMSKASLNFVQIAYITGERPISVRDHSQLGEFNYSRLLPGMLDAFEFEVLGSALIEPTSGYRHHINLNVRSDMIGVTMITMSLNGGAERTFIYPTMMGNLISPCLTPDKNEAKKFYDTMGTVIDSVFS